MSRPSANLDIKLIEAGKKIISVEGLRGLTIPNICKVANVNLGIFNYHFKTRDNYIKILYNSIRESIEKYVKMEKVADKNSLERLHYLMIKLSDFTKKHQKLVRFIFIDCLMCSKCNNKLVDKEILPTFRILNLVIKAQNDGFLMKEIPTVEIYSSLILGFLGPEIFKKEFIDREKALKTQGPKFADFPVEERLHNILKDYIKGTV